MMPPITTLACHGTPISQASGAKTQPSIPCSDSPCAPNRPPSQPTSPFRHAIRPMKAISIEPTATATRTPLPVPIATASNRLAARCSSKSRLSVVTRDGSLLGSSSLANSRPPGIAMNEAAIR